MPFNHEAVAALPASGSASKALVRAMNTRRFAYCLAGDENVTDFVAVDPADGSVPLYLIQNSVLYAYDAADSTTPHDGTTCLVTSDGKRYKYGDVTIFLGLLTATDVGLGNVDNTSDATKNAAVGTLTNKTIDAHANTISNLDTTMFATNIVDTDPTLAGSSDARIPTQKAVKTYLDSVIAATDVMVFKGVIDCSANPNYPAADIGHTYRVSVAGRIGGASGVKVEVADLLICLADGTASGNQATFGASWTITQANLDGAVIGPAAAVDANFAQFDGATGKIIKDGGIALDADSSFSSNSDSKIPTQKAVKSAIAAVSGGGASGHGQCRLDFVSATQIKLSPFNGDKLQIAGTVVQVPSSGVTAANTSVYVNGTSGQNLAASTVYNVYLFNNAGTLTIDFSATARAADATAGNIGIQIKSGDSTRTLVGKIETNASSQFVSTSVLSWFNRQLKTVIQTDGADRTAATIWTELNSSARARFLSWGDTQIAVTYSVCAKHATVGAAMYVGAGLDGVSSVFGGQSASEYVANNFVTLSTRASLGTVGEGVHYATLVGGAGSGSTTFAGTNIPSRVEVEYWG